jgi:DNA/RNA endonuclease G (NUC1)
MAPDGDFIDAGSQDATYYFLNTAPQWQNFNGANWK